MILASVHLVMAGLLLWLGYAWLGMDESDTRHLALSGAVVLALILGFTALRGLALAKFSGLTLKEAARHTARNLLPLLVLSLLAVAIYAGLTWLSGSFGKTSYLISSATTMALKKPIPPSWPQRVFGWALWLLRWVVVPGLLWQIAAQVAVSGWSGWKLQKKPWFYWLEVSALVLCAVAVPLRLFFWIPQISSFSGQSASFVSRAGAGYLLFVLAPLLLDFLTASGKPRTTQVSTVASP